MWRNGIEAMPQRNSSDLHATIAKFLPELTSDGSLTFYSAEFDETFHSRQGALQEAMLKFVEPTQLKLKAQQGYLRLLDVCYGLGYNTGAALSAIWAENPACQVELIGLECDSAVPLAAIHCWCSEQFNQGTMPQTGGSTLESSLRLGAAKTYPWSKSVYDLLAILATQHRIKTDRLNAHLLLGDARQTIQPICQSGFLADAIFLDPFSPPRCPQLWSVEFLACVVRCLHSRGRLATYSCAASVRAALMAAGVQVGSTAPVGRKSPGTVASWSAAHLSPLSPQEQEHLATRAAIPYRDPQLSDSATGIVARRQAEQCLSPLESTSQWRKRWDKIAKAMPVFDTEIAKQP